MKMHIPRPKTKFQFAMVYGFAFLFVCVIFHKNIENLFVDYSIYETHQQLASFTICEGNHPVKNLPICKNYLEKLAWWGGIVFAFYHEQYGTEAKRNNIKLSMCNDVLYVKQLIKIPSFRHKENKWTEWCEQHEN